MSGTSEAALSERDRFWWKHHEAQVASGRNANVYAAEQDLSLHAFYQGRKRLRAIGVLSPARERQKKAAGVGESRQGVRFAKVAVTAPRTEGPRLRVDLANGYAVEWAGSIEMGPVLDLVERIAQLR
jgi:hypothetical protein